MPFSVSLAPYLVSLRNQDDGSCLKVDDIFGKDFLSIFAEYLEQLKTTASHDRDQQHLIGVTKHAVDGRVIHGLFRAGDYGYEADLYDIEEQHISYNRKSTEAQLLPFYFLLSVPTSFDRAVLILERFQQYGVRSALWTHFRSFFQEHVPDVTLTLNPLVPAGLLEKLQSAQNVRSVRFIQFGVPSDIADALGSQGPIEEEGVLELVVKAQRGRELPVLSRVSEWLRGEAGLWHAIELHGFDFDNVKVQLDVNGRQRTVDIGRGQAIRAQYDITNDVVRDESGHPTFESIDGAALALLEELHEQIGIFHA